MRYYGTLMSEDEKNPSYPQDFGNKRLVIFFVVLNVPFYSTQNRS